MPNGQLVSDALIEMYKYCYSIGRELWARVITDVALANSLAPYANVIYRVVLNGHEFYADHPFHDEASALAAANAMYDGPQAAYHNQVDKRCWLQFVNEAEFRPLDWAFNIQLAKRCKADGRRLAMFGDATANRSKAEWIARNTALDYCMNSSNAAGVPQSIVVVNAYGYMYEQNGKLVTTDHLVSTPGEYEWFGNWMQDRYQVTSSKPYVVYAESQTSDAVFRGTGRLTQDMVLCNKLDNQYPWLLARLWYTNGRAWNHPEYQINQAIPQIEQTIVTL